MTAFTSNFSIPYQTVSDAPSPLGRGPAEDGFVVVDSALTGLDTRIDVLEARVPLATLVAYKTADETVTSNVTLQSDDHMTVTLAANGVYIVRNVFLIAGDDAGDLRVNYAVPTGTVGWAGQSALFAPVGASTASDVNMVAYQVSGTSLTTDLAIGIADTNLVLAVVEGLLEVGGTGGAFTTRWAQFVSNVTGTTLKRGSYLRAERIA